MHWQEFSMVILGEEEEDSSDSCLMRQIPRPPFHQGPCPLHLLGSAPLQVYYWPCPATLRAKSSTKHIFFFLLGQIRNNSKTRGEGNKKKFELLSTTGELLD